MTGTGRENRLDAGRLDELLAQAHRQSDMLETLRTSVAERTFSSPGR